MQARTIDITNTDFPAWTRVWAPTVERPHWHEEDGAVVGYQQLAPGLTDEQTEQLEEMHRDAIGDLIAEGMRALHRKGGHQEARRLLTAAARLTEEVIGLWPATHRAPLM